MLNVVDIRDPTVSDQMAIVGRLECKRLNQQLSFVYL